MRIAVIADIHASRAALDAVLEDIAGAANDAAIDAAICLGDLVGYNAEPAACIVPQPGTTRLARRVLDWTRDQTCAANARAGLPDELSARLREGR